MRSRNGRGEKLHGVEATIQTTGESKRFNRHAAAGCDANGQEHLRCCSGGNQLMLQRPDIAMGTSQTTYT